ncbi:GRIM-19 protein [Sphaerosporella brunnea]|uniref:NADH dehydrogenase [ubiquinone] 1 alpha subcomplex subunit 13 n=1 Tax=Sphaerosporella brunnea TaxID=1250544 RepID=A0A5J5F1D8_9PEZI|nr:GRIM-19 protein [Sphaerosporella brunnea]
MVQDLPPTGGYEPVQYRRNLPFRGFRPSYYLLGMGVVCAYGFYETMKGIKEQRENAREKIWARIHLTPMLQAEADRDDVRRYFAAQAREKELMKDEKGWDSASVYNVDNPYGGPADRNRFIRPTYTVAPPSESVIPEKEVLKILEAEAERQ